MQLHKNRVLFVRRSHLETVAAPLHGKATDLSYVKVLRLEGAVRSRNADVIVEPYRSSINSGVVDGQAHASDFTNLYSFFRPRDRFMASALQWAWDEALRRP